MGPRKRQGEPEYRMLVTPFFDETNQRHTTLVILATVQFFATFRYELSVEERREGKAIHYRILGLKAPQVGIPGAGQAQFRREYTDLKGTCEMRIEGLDGTVHSQIVRISPKKVQIVKRSPKGFVELVTDPAIWSKLSAFR